LKRFLILVSAHLFLFLLVIAYQAQAEEEWTIDRYETLSYARVSGEVVHGDSLNFFIGSRENCETVYNNFTFVTYEKPGDIYQLEGKNIPIKINGEDFTAKVQAVNPFLIGFRVTFSLGEFPVKEYIHRLNNFYKKENKYEIEIVDGIDFKAAKYFDITTNNWKLDKLVPSVLKANKLCETISHLDS